MRILYISEDYLTTKVHYNLCNEFSKKGLDVVVFTVFREKYQTNKSSTFGEAGFPVHIYKYIGNQALYKYNFSYKIREKYMWLKSNIDLSQFDLIVSATMFSDGAVAYEIFKEFGTQYITCVRGTDVNFYLRMMFHLWNRGRKILLSAKKIIPITKQIESKLLKATSLTSVVERVKSKSLVINNGIDQIWIDNYFIKKNKNCVKNIIYIGIFDANKNVERLQKAVLVLKKEFKDIKLTLVGGGDTCHNSVLKICKDNPETFNYIGAIYDRQKLMMIVREHDVFAMVSHSETFGLVYIEALSQGLNILYTKGQGVDGVFTKKLGESVFSNDLDSIVTGLRKLIENYSSYGTASKEDIDRFSWANIAEKYLKYLSD